MMYHDSLENYMQNNFSLLQHHNWSLSDIEGMIPWEKQTYIKMLQNYIEKRNLEYEQAKNE
jgi:hypothetical protein|tara:strand:- start:705 stop:887 length:183 start_codon:yes stop_codon:yes gene_type:complete